MPRKPVTFPIKPHRDVSYFKSAKFPNHITLGELCRVVKRDRSWIRHLEATGRIPNPARVKRGKIEIRLYSPEQVKEVDRILKTLRPGRPRNA